MVGENRVIRNPRLFDASARIPAEARGTISGMAGEADSRAELEELEREEQSLSARRRRLHDRIDFLRGGGDPEAVGAELDRLLEEESRVSARRREIHRRLDELRPRDAGSAPTIGS